MRSLTPLPSGYVRVRRGTAASTVRWEALRLFAEGGLNLLDSTIRALRGLKDELVRRHQRAAMIHQLSSLSDYALKDIGLSRGDLRAAVMDVERGVDPRYR